MSKNFNFLPKRLDISSAPTVALLTLAALTAGQLANRAANPVKSSPSSKPDTNQATEPDEVVKLTLTAANPQPEMPRTQEFSRLGRVDLSSQTQTHAPEVRLVPVPPAPVGSPALQSHPVSSAVSGSIPSVNPQLVIAAVSQSLQADQIAQPESGSSSQGSFSDLEGHWGAQYVFALADRGIVQGFPDGTFQPDETVTRAQFAEVIRQAFHQSQKRADPDFTDVLPNHWAYPSIQTAYSMGFFSDSSNHHFDPDQSLSRRQAWNTIMEGLDIDDPEVNGQLLLTWLRIINPQRAAQASPNALPNPNQAITRAEIAALITVALQFTEQSGASVTQAPTPSTPLQPVLVASANPPTLAELEVQRTQGTIDPPSPQLISQPEVMALESSPESQLDQPSPQSAIAAAQQDETYRLGPGDQIFIDLFGLPNYSQDYQVLVDGSLNLPRVGQVFVAGMTLKEAEAVVFAKYSQFYREPATSIILKTARPLKVAVAGEINRPGVYTLRLEESAQFPRVTEVIQQAGGISADANLREIRVRRPQPDGSIENIQVNLWDLIQNGELEQDITLRDGDRIIIPKASEILPQESAQVASANFSPTAIQVNIVGEVGSPGPLQVPPHTPLNQALLAAGGLNEGQASRKVELIRLNPNGTVTQREIQVDLTQGISEQHNPILRQNDVIVVDRSGVAKARSTAGTILGSIFRILPFFAFF
jgi:polysaccharide export outer membrane protein